MSRTHSIKAVYYSVLVLVSPVLITYIYTVLTYSIYTYLCQMLLYGQYFNGQKEGLCFESSLLKKSKRTLHE